MDNHWDGCQQGKLFVISNDSFFYKGLIFLISSIMPELLEKTGVIYNIEHVNIEQWNHLNNITINSNNYFIIDFDSRMRFNSVITNNLFFCKMRGDRLIIFDTILQPPDRIYCFYKKMPLKKLKQQLLDVVSGTALADIAEYKNYMLSKKERQVINYVLMGESMQSIARIMNMHIKTAYTLRSSAYKKVGVTTLQGLFYNASKITFEHC